MSLTYCSICSKPVFGDNGPIGDIVDCYKYDFDGTLDYILLMHRQCAKRKGYKIVGDTVVTGHWAEKSLKSEHIVKHGSGYRLVSHKGKNLGDFPTRAAAAKHEGEVEYFKKHEETQHESQQLEPSIRTEAMPELNERYEATCPKCKKSIERQGGSGEHCPKCGASLPYESNWTRATRKENSDAAPAISRMEGTVVKKFGATILEMEDPKKLNEVTPPGKESWVKANKAGFKKEYGDKKGTEVLYATAWKNKKKNEGAEVNEAFTRQHYESIAKMIKEIASFMETRQQEEVLEDLVEKLAAYFKEDNPRFDKGRFIIACGI